MAEAVNQTTFSISNTQMIRADLVRRSGDPGPGVVVRAVGGFFESWGYRVVGFFSGARKGRCCASASEYARAYALKRLHGGPSTTVTDMLDRALVEVEQQRDETLRRILGSSSPGMSAQETTSPGTTRFEQFADGQRFGTQQYEPPRRGEQVREWVADLGQQVRITAHLVRHHPQVIPFSLGNFLTRPSSVTGLRFREFLGHAANLSNAIPPSSLPMAIVRAIGQGVWAGLNVCSIVATDSEFTTTMERGFRSYWRVRRIDYRDVVLLVDQCGGRNLWFICADEPR